MVDWLSSMTQTFEYYIVDPGTWRNKKKIDCVTASTITRDLSAETLGSATIDMTETIDECYIRIYLVTIQNGIQERHPLGTFLVQTPSSRFNGKVTTVSLDAYTPLLELKENSPPLGYSLFKGENIMNTAYNISIDHARAPVVNTESDITLVEDFVANTDDSWLSFQRDLIANAKYELALDEMGRILFAPKQDTASLQPIWTYNDDNSSILYPDIDFDRDLYGIPNVVEVIYSTSRKTYYSRVVNDDPNSPISTVNRGREIVHRDTEPAISGYVLSSQVDEYAKQLLRDLSSIEYSISYEHGYCPVRIGDCVRLKYNRAGLSNVKAKVVSQSIKCTPGCPVSETAVFTKQLWG